MNLEEKKLAFVANRLEEVFGIKDPLNYLQKRPATGAGYSAVMSWKQAWLNAAEIVFPFNTTHFQWDGVVTRFLKKSFAALTSGLADWLIRGDLANIYGLPNVFGAIDAYLVEYRGKAGVAQCEVIGRRIRSITNADVVLALLFRWDDIEARSFLLERLTLAVKSIAKNAESDFDRAVAISSDGKKICSCDVVVVVSEEGTDELSGHECPGKFIRPNRFVRKRRGWKSPYDINTAVSQVRRGETKAVFFPAYGTEETSFLVISSDCRRG
ncbi:MAG TPA: hypothetical protein PKZ16_00945 [bacterium]|nr:hypothetical protein [bacterium]HPL95450.1 hypothetical protein [bacterium]